MLESDLGDNEAARDDGGDHLAASGFPGVLVKVNASSRQFYTRLHLQLCARALARRSVLHVLRLESVVTSRKVSFSFVACNGGYCVRNTYTTYPSPQHTKKKNRKQNKQQQQ